MAFQSISFVSLLLFHSFSTAFAQETISFPGSAGDLEPNSYWVVSEFSEGCCTLDMNVHRWDGDGKQWVKDTNGGYNDDDYSFHVPVYAPVDGEIASCWRQLPDNPKPGIIIDAVGTTINAGANHVEMITRAGNWWGIIHLEKGTVPPTLCPPNSIYPPNLDITNGWRDAMFVPQGSRKRISEGDFIGRVGNSGFSTGPHIHMGFKDITGTLSGPGGIIQENKTSSTIPLPFRNVWAKPFVKNKNTGTHGWYPLYGKGFFGDSKCKEYLEDNPDCGFKFLHASPFLQRSSDSENGATFVDTHFVSPYRVITAVRTSQGKLRLTSWSIAVDGSITRKDSIDAGAIKMVRLSSPDSNHVLAAVQLTDNRLKMIAYHVAVNGTLTRVADKTAGSISDLRSIDVGHPKQEEVTVTAVRTSGKLKLIIWDINIAADGSASVVRLGDVTGSEITHLDAKPAPGFYGLYTVVRDSNGAMKITSWEIATDLNTLSIVGEFKAETVAISPAKTATGLTNLKQTAPLAGPVTIGPAKTTTGLTKLKLIAPLAGPVAIAPSKTAVATAVKLVTGQMAIYTFATTPNGQIGNWTGQRFIGPINLIEIFASPVDDASFTTLTRGEDLKQTLIGWTANLDGTNLRRVGTSRTGVNAGIAGSMVSRSYSGTRNRGLLANATIEPNSKMKLIIWDTNLARGDSKLTKTKVRPSKGRFSTKPAGGNN